MLIVQRPQIEEQVVSDNRSQFIVEPLEPGFGYTLGNTLRRTLLSRVPGAAVTSMQIEGVKHEFSTVNGVVEDVVDIILNLKQLVVRMEEGEAQTLYLSAKGKGEVTAADLKVPAGVEVVNPKLHIATLSSSGRLEMELTVEQGVGYRSAVKQTGAAAIGTIPIDAPISKAVIDDIVKLAKEQLDRKNQDFEQQSGFLRSSIAQAERQIETISAQQQQFELGAKHDKAYLDKVEALLKKGTATQIRVVEARRNVLLSETRALQASAELMPAFYRNLYTRGLSRAQALRTAQVDMLASEQFWHPAYWAAYILIGNWQ